MGPPPFAAVAQYPNRKFLNHKSPKGTEVPPMPDKVKIRNVTPKRFSDGAPNPGYDREAVAPERVEMNQPQYPETFAARLRGKPGNINAQSQAAKSKRYE